MRSNEKVANLADWSYECMQAASANKPCGQQCEAPLIRA